jgi:hypothetical protein
MCPEIESSRMGGTVSPLNCLIGSCLEQIRPEGREGSEPAAKSLIRISQARAFLHQQLTVQMIDLGGELQLSTSRSNRHEPFRGSEWVVGKNCGVNGCCICTEDSRKLTSLHGSTNMNCPIIWRLTCIAFLAFYSGHLHASESLTSRYGHCQASCRI